MKVALIDPPLIGHKNRGTGMYTQQLAEALETYSNLEIVHANISEIPKNIDIVHYPYFDPFFLTLRILRNIKTVVTVHDLIPIKFPAYFPRGIKGELKWQIQKRKITRVNALITDSNASKLDILEYTQIPEAKVHVVHLAPSKIFYTKRTIIEKEQVKEKYGLPKQFILYVGDANWNKNVITIIKAVNTLTISLVIVSTALLERTLSNYNPWQDSLIEAQKEIRKSDQIITLGRITAQELATLYQCAQALVFPSFYEGFGLPIVEAFVSGCPVITTQRGSLKEIAGDAAYFIMNPEDERELSSAVIKLTADKNMQKDFIRKGKLWVKKFNWKKTALLTKEIYEKC